MSRPWAFWYPEAMGCQERLWCAAQVDDPEEVRKSLHQGASSTLPGPGGSARDLANSHQSYRTLATTGWATYEEQGEPISLEDLDFASQQVDTLKQGLDLEMPEDDFLDLLPFLGNARLVNDSPYAWLAPEGVSSQEAHALFRLTHEHEAVVVMTSPSSTPVLLLSHVGAKKWAPRLAESSLLDDQRNSLN